MRTPQSGLSLSCIWFSIVAAMATLATTAVTAYAKGGAAASWGENYHGQLGMIYRDRREESPVGVEGLTNITAIAAGADVNIALLGNGTLASWGGNDFGQLGNDGYKANWELGKSHVVVSELTGVHAVAASRTDALALLENGTVKAWEGNQYGQLGDGKGGFEGETGENQRVPKTVNGLTGVVAVASGGASNYALLENGTVMAWGSNTRGQLGIAWPKECQKHNTPGCGAHECKTEAGMELCSTTPQLVMAGKKPLDEVVAVSAGQTAAYALLKDGHAMSWGSDAEGKLGQPGIEPTPSDDEFIAPGTVMRSGTEALANVEEVSAGYSHVLARLEDGEVVGWGDNQKGQLGARSESECNKTPCDRTATPIDGLERVTARAVSAGASTASC